MDPTDETIWRLLSTRNPQGDGKFLYAVKTTRIYCRPTCPSRLARRSNILIFFTALEAQRAGNRACKRCRPELQTFSPPEVEKVRKVVEVLREGEFEGDGPPGLEEMAGWVGLTKFHFCRLFKREVGVSPGKFAREMTEKRGSEICSAAAGTPSSGSSASTSGVITPEMKSISSSDDLDTSVQIPAIEEDQFLINDLDFPEDFDHDAMNLSLATNPSPPLFYTTAPTTCGYLLVGFQNSQVCWMDVELDHTLLLQRFEVSFPSNTHITLPIEMAEMTETAAMQKTTQEIVTGLESMDVTVGLPSFVMPADLDVGAG